LSFIAIPTASTAAGPILLYRKLFAVGAGMNKNEIRNEQK